MFLRIQGEKFCGNLQGYGCASFGSIYAKQGHMKQRTDPERDARRGCKPWMIGGDFYNKIPFTAAFVRLWADVVKT